MRRRTLLIIFLVVASLTGVHVYVVGQGANYSGFLLFLNHLFDITIVLTLLGLYTAVGKRLLTGCHCEFDRPLESLLFSVAIGSGLVATVILILGFFSGLQIITLTAVLVLLAIGSRNEILGLPKLVAQAAIELRQHSNILNLLMFVLAAVFMISQALLPPMDWDSLVYHLRVPAQFLDADRIYLPEDNLHVAFAQLVHMLYLPLLAYGSVSGPALLSAFFALLFGFAVFALSNRFFNGQTAAFSAAILWANTIVLIVAATPRVDITLAYYLLLAHFALLRASSDWKYFYLSAILLGLAAGIKYHAIAYGVGLAPLIVWAAYLKQGNIRQCFLSSCAYGLLAVAGVFPWLVKNWLLFGAPLYPFFTQRKIDPWLSFLYPEKIQPEIINVYGEMRVPFNIIDLFFNPLALHVGAEAIFYRFSPLFVCLVLWLIYYSKNRTLNWLMIPALCHFVVTLIFSSKTNLRYLIPVLAPFTIVTVHTTLDRLVNWLGPKKAVILFYAISLVVLWPAAKTLTPWITGSTPLSYLAGFTSREDYLTNIPGFGSTVSYVNQNISPKDRVLMLFEGRGFYFDVPVIQDNLFSNWILLARKASSLNCLENSGISHVLFNGAAIDYFSERGLDSNLIYLEEFERFAEECLTLIYQGHNYVVYRVGK